jgi:hypothetical protein
MLYELRQYRTKPGQRETWVSYFHAEVVPFQTSKGMKVLGSWVGEEEDDLFVWMREFASEEERVRLYKEVYETDEWKNRIGPPIRDMLDGPRIVVTRLLSAPA